MKRKMRVLIFLVLVFVLSGCREKLRTEDLLKEGSNGNIEAFLYDEDGKFIWNLHDEDSKEIKEGDTVVIRAPYTKQKICLEGATLLEQRGQKGVATVVVIRPELDSGSAYIEVMMGNQQISFVLKQ